MVFGDGKHAGSAIVSHPSVRAISFTGSTVVGHYIQEHVAKQCKKLSLEVCLMRSSSFYVSASKFNCLM